jgi:hypothetical protein
MAAFRHFIENQPAGRIFETQEQFLRDMANEQHLNFNRSVLASLLPQAMAFTNSTSFDKFIRNFVLPGDQLNVSDVITSYRSFLAFERDLIELHDQLTRLQAIHELHQSHEAAKRDQIVARWLVAELTCRHASDVVRERESELARETAEFAKEADRMVVLDKLIENQKREIEQLRSVIRSSPDGALYLFIIERNKGLINEIENLRAIGTRVDDALRNRVRKARQWLGEVQSVSLTRTVDASRLDAAIKRLEGCDADNSTTALMAVAEAADQMKVELNLVTRPLREKSDELRRALGKLREEIGALEIGRLPFPTVLLQSLLDALPRQSREPSAQPLCHLCELMDEKWRAAIEVAFARKFSLVVSEANYAQAMNIYHELKVDSPHESLVDPTKAMSLSEPIHPGSLAEKIQTEHPVARAVVSQLFGSLICVENFEGFGKYDHAILPDGFTRRGAFVERPRHYDNTPFVGRRGLEQQLAMKRSQRKDIEAEERRIGPMIEAVQGVLDRASQLIPDHASLADDLRQAQGLMKLIKERDDNVSKLQTIDHANFDEKNRRVNELADALLAWEKERTELLGRGRRVSIQRIEAELTTARAKESDEFHAREKIQQEIGDISIYASRMNEWRAEIAETFPTLFASAHEFARLEREAYKKVEGNWQKLVSDRKLLTQAYPRFDELIPDNPSNAEWDKLWQQVAEAKIPDFEDKAKAARARWEHLFRNNIFQKLDQAMRRLRNDVKLLNDHLKTPIGNDIYEIDVKPNPDFKLLRDLVNLNALHQPDSPGQSLLPKVHAAATFSR